MLVAADDVVEQGVDVLALVGALLLTELLLLDLGRREEHAPSSVGGLGLRAIVARRFVNLARPRRSISRMELIERGRLARRSRRASRTPLAGPGGSCWSEARPESARRRSCGRSRRSAGGMRASCAAACDGLFTPQPLGAAVRARRAARLRRRRRAARDLRRHARGARPRSDGGGPGGRPLGRRGDARSRALPRPQARADAGAPDRHLSRRRGRARHHPLRVVLGDVATTAHRIALRAAVRGRGAASWPRARTSTRRSCTG